MFYCEDGGDPQPHSGRGWTAVQVETDPGHDDYQTAGHVDLDDVVTHGPANIKGLNLSLNA